MVSISKNNKAFDVAISGAGPAGLTAAVACAQADLKVVVCEKAAVPGPVPRGETVRDDPFLDQLLGMGNLRSSALHMTNLRKFNSPLAQKAIEIERPSPSLIFRWRDLIDRLYHQATSAGVTFRFNTAVTAAHVDSERCKGVVSADGEVIEATTVLACDGHSSALGRWLGIPYDSFTHPTFKCHLQNVQDQYPGLEFFFLGRNMYQECPMPAAVLFLFPRGNGECEGGIMTFPRFPLTDLRWREINKCLPDYWSLVISRVPRLSSLLEHANFTNSWKTAIPMARKVISPMRYKGLIALGDATGFVEAAGASGLLSSMQAAYWTGEFLGKWRKNEWTGRDQMHFNRSFMQSSVARHIRKKSRVVFPVLNMVFHRLGTAEKITSFWWLVKAFYRFS